MTESINGHVPYSIKNPNLLVSLNPRNLLPRRCKKFNLDID